MGQLTADRAHGFAPDDDAPRAATGPPAAPPISRAGAVARAAIAAAAAATLLFLVVQAFAGATQVGVSTDEPSHVSRMQTWLDTGWYLPGGFLADGEPRADIDTGRHHAYGAAFSAVGHAVAVVAGVEPLGGMARTSAAHTARGITVALLGVAAALAVGYALWISTGSRLVGLWAAAAVMAIPLWTGYSMFAIKDVPAAAGWTMVTAGLVAALHPVGRRRALVAGVLCGVGVWFSVGVRTALWVPLAAMLGTFLVLAWRRWRLAVPVVAGAGIGFLAVAALHYRNAATPVRWLISSVATSGDFGWAGATLTAGRLVSEKPPWWYLPAWVGGSVPILIGLLAAAGGALALVLVARRRGSPAGVLWLQQAVMLPVVATVAGSTMYAGLRQHLYVLPAIAALAAVAAARLRRVPVLGPVVLIVALLAPVVDQVALFPYQHVYKNALAAPVNDRWELDMHWVSTPEALRRVPADVTVYCYTKSIRRGDGVGDPRPFRTCETYRQVAPFVGERPPERSDERVWVLARRYRGSLPAPGCTDAGSVTRRLRGETLTLSYVLLCDRQPATSAATG